jgi:hypothetical protein
MFLEDDIVNIIVNVVHNTTVELLLSQTLYAFTILLNPTSAIRDSAAFKIGMIQKYSFGRFSA